MRLLRFECVGGAHSPDGCGHRWSIEYKKFGCPPGYKHEDCGAKDPGKCIYYPESTCWGCSPCGRSRRRWRCSMCPPRISCPECGNDYVKQIVESKSERKRRRKRR